MIFDIETAAFADAIKKASPIGKIDEYGIQVVADKKANSLEVIAFSRNSTYRQLVLDATIHEAGSVVILNDKFNMALSRFPTSTTTQVGMDTAGKLTLTCGKLKGKYMVKYDGEYPKVRRINEITDRDLVEVEDLSNALKSVAWVAAKESEAGAPWTGITIDGTRVIGCSQTQLCEIDLDVPVDEPVTIPAVALQALVPKNLPVQIGAADYRFLIKPDPETEMTTTIYNETHAQPALAHVRKSVEDQCHERFTFDLEHFSTAVGRIRTIADKEEVPKIKITTEGSEMTLSVVSTEGDSLSDTIPCTRVAGSENIGMTLHPKIIKGLTSMRGPAQLKARPAASPAGMIGFFCDNGVTLIAAVMKSI